MKIEVNFLPISRMYQMGPKSPSVNGAPPTGPGGKPPAVSDAQAREKLAVSFLALRFRL